MLIGLEQFSWVIILGLLIGGVISAPIAAFGCKKLPQKILGTLLGITVLILSTRMIIRFIGFI